VSEGVVPVDAELEMLQDRSVTLGQVALTHKVNSFSFFYGVAINTDFSNY